MKFNIISNVTNGVGLEQDATMLAELLEARGHQARKVQFNARPIACGRADVNVFLELVVPEFFGYASVNWLVPNPEWHAKTWPLDKFDLVLAKTLDAERIFQGLVGDRCRYIGWAARDLYRADIPRERRFLHVAGKSHFKNTEAVIAGCRMAGVEVAIVSEHYANHRRIGDEELIALMNSHRFFLCPSAYEGYGQALHEALGCGAVIITTDASPMNEITPAILIPSDGANPHHLGMLHHVTPEAVAAGVRRALEFSAADLDRWERRSREQYQAGVKKFEVALDAVLAEMPVCA